VRGLTKTILERWLCDVVSAGATHARRPKLQDSVHPRPVHLRAASSIVALVGAFIFGCPIGAAAQQSDEFQYPGPPQAGFSHSVPAPRLLTAAQAEQVPADQSQVVPPFRPQAPVGSTIAPSTGTETPSPTAGIFGPGQSILPLLGETPRAGTSPHPSPAVLDQFKQFVDHTVDAENTLDLIQGRPRLLILKQAPIHVQIADDRVAEFQFIPREAGRQISIVGNRVGSTLFNLWFVEPDGQKRILSYLVRVVPDPEQKERLDHIYKALEREINRAFPNSVVHLALLGDKLVVSGEAKDIVDAYQILRVVSANAPGGAGRNQGEIQQIPVGQLNLTAVPDASGNLPQQGLENFLLRDINRFVVNLLHVAGEQQVMVQVTVAEIDRTAARSIGMDFSVLNAAGSTVFETTTAGLLPTTLTGAGSSASVTGGNILGLIDNGKVSLAIQALRNLNLARSLAEQDLVTLNGQTANFQAGGEFPVPAATATFGAVGQGVSFVPFGVSLQFIPSIPERDRVRLRVSATVSTLDPSLGTTVNSTSGGGGTSVPGLQSRTFSSTVEMRSGQTLAVAGLIQTNFGSTSVRVPFFGDLPILGPLAGKNNDSSGEQEVVVLITPRLVHPLEACHTPPLPGADVSEPGDIEFYLLNRLESRRSYDNRTSVRTDWDRMHRYDRCDDVFILGAHGQTYGCCSDDPTASCAGPRCAGRIPPCPQPTGLPALPGFPPPIATPATEMGPAPPNSSPMNAAPFTAPPAGSPRPGTASPPFVTPPAVISH
jgi:pilus assembly protein CpaC